MLRKTDFDADTGRRLCCGNRLWCWRRQTDFGEASCCRSGTKFHFCWLILQKSILFVQPKANLHRADFYCGRMPTSWCSTKQTSICGRMPTRLCCTKQTLMRSIPTFAAQNRLQYVVMGRRLCCPKQTLIRGHRQTSAAESRLWCGHRPTFNCDPRSTFCDNWSVFMLQEADFDADTGRRLCCGKQTLMLTQADFLCCRKQTFLRTQADVCAAENRQTLVQIRLRD